MKKILSLALLATLALGLPTCKPDTAKTATDAAAATNPGAPAAVQAQLTVLRDSADASWQRLVASDDQKLANARALLTDLKAQPGLSAVRLDSLAQAVTQLQARRYTHESMAESALIDQYDAAQSALLRLLYQVAAPGGNAPTDRIRGYVEAIQTADTDNAVLGYRVHYDRDAKAYNTYLKLHQDELTKLGGAAASQQPLPLFELSQ